MVAWRTPTAGPPLFLSCSGCSDGLWLVIEKNPPCGCREGDFFCNSKFKIQNSKFKIDLRRSAKIGRTLDRVDTDKEIRSISRKIFGRLFIKSRREKSDVSRKEQPRRMSRDIMLLLLPKVAQKHRTASLSGAECAKSKTNAVGGQSIWRLCF